ncbi:hypothetical protein, partial [Microcoleus sp. D3_18cC1]
MSSISIYFSPLLEDFNYETGVKNPCRIVGLNRAGETPTPQENSFFVEQASCLFLRDTPQENS